MKNTKRKKKPSPVFVIPALSITYLVEYNLDTLVSIEKIQKKKKNTYQWPVNLIPAFPELLRTIDMSIGIVGIV